MSEILLSAKNVKKSIGKTSILNGVFADFFLGDFTVIMGQSGSGKSTLLYALSGMESASEGNIFYKNFDIAKLSEKKLCRIRATDFSFVFQQMHLISNLTLYENILAGAAAKKIPQNEIQKKAEELLEKMSLKDAAQKYPSQVSGGEAQRAAIARAVVKNPKIIFADEPTGSLNKACSSEVLKLFCQLNEEGISVVMVTHDQNAALCGKRILYLEDGKITGELNLPKKNCQSENEAENEKRKTLLFEWLKKMKW